MKTNFADLSEAYKSFIKEKRKTSKETCPAVEEIVRCLRSEATKKESKAIHAHIVACPDCLRIARSFMEIIKAEHQFIKEIKQIQSNVEQEGREKSSFKWNRTYSKWALGAGLSIMSLIIIYCFAFRTVPGGSERGSLRDDIQISKPSEVKISRSDVNFSWARNPDVIQYTIEIYDNSLKTIWKSEPLDSNSIKPPADIILSLKLNESYFIMVRAINKNGKEIASKLKEFVVER